MNFNIVFEDRIIEYSVIYSKRKTLEISIKAPGLVTVRAPQYVSKNQIEKTLRKKEKWLIEKLHFLNDSKNIPIKKNYVSGEYFMYLGKNYILDLVINEGLKKPEIKLTQHNLIITAPTRGEDIIRQAMEAWYKEMAKQMIEERISYYSKYFNEKVNSIKIKAQKTRWGSCNYKNDLFFNYKLIMSPLSVLDYVVVHEMCHMEHKHHQKSFWNNVASIVPDYNEKRKWLKEHGAKLEI